MFKKFNDNLKKQMEIDRSKKEIFKSFSKEKKLFLYGNLSILTGI
jgi:hypothetical protein